MTLLSFNGLISQRFRGLLYLCVLMLVVLAAYFSFRQFSYLQQLKSFHFAQIAQLRELKQTLDNSPDFKAQHQQDQEKINQFSGLIAHSDQTTQAAIVLSNQLVQSGLQIKLFQPGASQLQAQFIHFQVLGSYRQLIDFLRTNSNRWPLNVVQEFNIVPEASTSSRLLISGVFKICGEVDKALSETAC